LQIEIKTLKNEKTKLFNRPIQGDKQKRPCY
jgi:hypothetical protein